MAAGDSAAVERAASSFHRICGDEPLSLAGKALYALCYVREKFTERAAHPGLRVTPWQPVLDEARLTQVFGERLAQFTSNRVLCSDFMLEAGQRYLGEHPSIVDLGCGSGEYSAWLRSLYAYRRYLGIDVIGFDSWRGYETPEVRFQVGALGTMPIDVTGYDAVFSSSALEHIRFDKQVFLDLWAREPQRVRHLHLIPGLPSFFQYKAHGFRRYCLKYIRALTEVPGVSDVQVFSIGNSVSRACVRGAGGETALAQLQARKSRIVPADARDAPFFALCFDQVVGPESRR